jgi:hypothetical protein
MVEEPVEKTPPPTQHISFEDEEAQITEIPKQTGLTHPDLSEKEIQEFVQKYNIEIAYSPKDSFREMSYLVLGLGFVLAIYVWLASAIDSDNSGQCCGIMLLSMSIAPFLDAAHYSKKKEWQQKHAMDHKSSDNSIAINMMLGIILSLIVVVWFILL